jgi:hypothetical protein
VFALAQQATTFTVQGVVLRSDSGAPLAQARVELRGLSPEPTTITTESDGKFSFFNLPIGSYEVTVRRERIRSVRSWPEVAGRPWRSAAVGSGPPIPNLTVRMVAAAAIVGRITDSAGQRLINAQVQALKSTFQGELRILVPFSKFARMSPGISSLWTSCRPLLCQRRRAGYAVNSTLLVNSSGRNDQGCAVSIEQSTAADTGTVGITASTNPGTF